MKDERIEEVYPKYELLSCHCGRRTFVVNGLYLGIPPIVIMEWTGHYDYKSMKPYTKVVNKLKDYAEKNYGYTSFNLDNGTTVVIHKNFIKIGYKVVYFNEFRELVGLTPNDIRRIYNNLR